MPHGLIDEAAAGIYRHGVFGHGALRFRLIAVGRVENPELAERLPQVVPRLRAAEVRRGGCAGLSDEPVAPLQRVRFLRYCGHSRPHGRGRNANKALLPAHFSPVAAPVVIHS